jgi:predicted metal-dependent hydrolase
MRLDYRIVYSRRRTMSMSVERDASVVVRAPLGTPDRTIRRAVEERKLWLFQKVNHTQKYPLLRQHKEFVSGESIPFLGKSYRLEIAEHAVGGIQFQSGFVISRKDQTRARDLFRRWYMERAEEWITSRAKYFARAMGVQFCRVVISDLRVRWGLCTLSGRLNFNWRLMKAPSVVIDYVTVHELAHLLEPNHTARFWNIVAVQAPQWEWAKTWLREHGNLLEEDF